MSKARTQEFLNKAQIHEENEDYESMHSALKAAHELDKDDIEVLEKLALNAQLLGKKSDAIMYWELFQKLDPNNFISYTQLQDLYLGEDKFKYYLMRAKKKTIDGSFSQAVADYKKAIEHAQDKDIAPTRFVLGQTYEFLKKPNEAINEYLRMLDVEPNIHAYYRLAELYAKEDMNSAIDILFRATEAFSGDLGLNEMLTDLLIKNNQLDDALKIAKSEAKKAKIYLAQDKNEEAKKIIDTLKQGQPQSLSLLAQYYYNTKNFDSSLETISKLQKLDGSNPLCYQMKALVYEAKADDFYAHYNWGKFYSLRHNFAMAQNEFLSAHALNSTDINTLNELIKIYENTNDVNTCVEFYEKLVEIDLKNEKILEKLADYWEKTGDREKTHQYKQRLSAINPDFYPLEQEPQIEEQEGFLDKLLGLFKK